jgi:O-antigen/teichoic acid export membrane protein
MIRQFLKDSVVYGFSRFLTYGISLILIPIYTRVFNPSDYGIIDILNVFESIVGLTIALEISQAVIRLFPEMKTEVERVAYSSTALWFTVFVYAVFVITAWVFADTLNAVLIDDNHHQNLFQIAVLAMAVVKIFIVAQTQLRCRLQPLQYAATSVLFALASAVISLLFIFVVQIGLIGVFIGELCGAAIAGMVAFYYSRRDFSFTFDFTKLREMLRFSVPLIPSSVAFFVYLYIDRIAIRELLSLDALGVFGIGYRVTSVVQLLMFGFQIALTPLIYTYHSDPRTPVDLARLFRLFLFGALIFSMGLILFADEVLLVMTGPAFYEAATVIPFLVPATLLLNMYIFTPGLSIQKKTHIFAAVNVVGAILNAVLNFVFIPIWGIQGAALATFLSSAIIFMSHMIFSQKSYPVPHEWIPILKSILLIVVVIWLGLQLDLELWAELVLKLVLIVITSLSIARIGLISRYEFQQGIRLIRKAVPFKGYQQGQ